jgi:PmbA protein
MLPLANLKSFAKAAASALARERDLADFEVYCSSGEELIARINYTSDISSRGVEEVKSNAADGFVIRVVFRRDPHLSATASEAGDFSLESLRRVLERARSAAVIDPHFPGLPDGARAARLAPLQAGKLASAPDYAVVDAAWTILRRALRSFERRKPVAATSPGLIIGGDVTLARDRIAVAGSHFGDIRADQSAHFSASVTAIIEALEAKGTATTLGGSLESLRRLGPLGSQAIERAIKLKDGRRMAGGNYRVMLGPQPVAEILNNIVIPSLTAGAFYTASSAYQGHFGATVMDSRLSLADDPLSQAGAIHRRISCEGLPSRRVHLIRNGRLIGLLSNFYDARRLAADQELADKLGPHAGGPIDVAPISGYRIGDGIGRRFDSHPGTTASNVVMRARGGVGERAMLRALGDGIYVGRVWYTYPINGQRAGDFTCTITGDSYLVKDGKPITPLAPNCLRINAAIDQVFRHVIAIGSRREAIPIWGSPEAYYVPGLVVESLPLSAIEHGIPSTAA